jgi:hypothetical protein
MTSTSVAFGKFSKWKNDKTSLRVTVWHKGKPSRPYPCRITDFDPSTGWMGISSSENGTELLDLEDSVFSVESKKVAAAQHGSVWLVFEELESIP